MINDNSVANLIELMRERLSHERFSHTLGVMRAAELLGKYCLGGRICELKAAALLHDVAKELTFDEQKQLITDGGGRLSDEDIACAPVLHAFAAPYAVKKYFPDFINEFILSAVGFHTTGDPNMSVFDEIVFLADFIEDTRPYKACKELRCELLDGLVPNSIEENQMHLHRMSLKMIDFTINYLNERNKPIHSKMLDAKKMLECKLLKK